MCIKEEFYLSGTKAVHIFCCAKNMSKFLQEDIMWVKNPRFFAIREKLLPINLEVEFIPRTEILVVDCGSRAPMTEGILEKFKTAHSDIGMKVKSRIYDQCSHSLYMVQLCDATCLKKME